MTKSAVRRSVTLFNSKRAYADAPPEGDHLKGGVAHFTLTSRPYSYADNLARGLLSCALVGQGGDFRSIWIASILSLLMWLFLNWHSETRQKDVGRLTPPKWVTWTPLVLSVGLCATVNPASLPFLAFYVGSILLYPLKAIAPAFGPAGPFFRTLTVAAHCLTVMAAVRDVVEISRTAILVIVALGVFHGTRNLVGDIRDIRQDRFEIPARYGFSIAMNIVRASFASILLLSCFIPHGILALAVPLVIQWIALEALAWRLGSGGAPLVGYLGHRLFVVLFTFSELAFAWMLGATPWICGTIGALTLLLHPTYALIPGKKYQSLASAVLTWRHARAH